VVGREVQPISRHSFSLFCRPVLSLYHFIFFFSFPVPGFVCPTPCSSQSRAHPLPVSLFPDDPYRACVCLCIHFCIRRPGCAVGTAPTSICPVQPCLAGPFLWAVERGGRPEEAFEAARGRVHQCCFNGAPSPTPYPSCWVMGATKGVRGLTSPHVNH
jgi:hypothetical protein